MSAERSVPAYYEQPAARRRVFQVRPVDGEKNQRGPFPGAIRARRTSIFVQIQRQPRKGRLFPRNGKVWS